MKIYKYNKDPEFKHYTIEILQSPIPFLDGNSRLGVYAHPYGHIGKSIFFKSTDFEGKCLDWIKENFTEYSHK